MLEYVAFKILKNFFLDPTYNKWMPSRKQALKPLYLISKRKINALSSAHLQMEYRKHHWKKKIIDCNQQNENRLGSRAFVKYVVHNGIKTIKYQDLFESLYHNIKVGVFEESWVNFLKTLLDCFALEQNIWAVS